MNVVAVLVTWYTSGLGYLMSVVMAPQNSMVGAVATCMIVGGFLNGVEPRYRALSPIMQKVIGMLSSLLHYTASSLLFAEKSGKLVAVSLPCHCFLLKD